MEVQEQTNAAPVETAVETPSAPESSAPAVNESAPPVEAYTPSYKYKVKDKEFEFDDEIKPLIKSKDAEAKWKRIFEKATGLDYVLQDKEAVSKQYQEYKKSYDPIVNLHQQAVAHYNRGDLDMAFETLGIPEKALMQHVLKKLQMQEMPPEQREAYSKATQAERENYTLKSQYEQQTQFMQQMLVQQRTQQLESALSQPEVGQIAQAYDQSNGQGAFRDAVIFIAQKHLASTGQDLSAQEAVERAAKMFGALRPQQPTPSTSAQTPGVGKPVPVIPVASGGGNSSPSAKMPRSVDDLLAIRKEKLGY